MLKTAVFIDGSNLYATAKTLGFSMDYKKLIVQLRTEYDVVRVYYYTAIRDTQENNPIIKLVDWLDYNGVKVITKDTKEYLQFDGSTKIKGNMDVEITTDMVMMADKVEHIMLFSGDGDFAYAVERIQTRGTLVTVASTIATQPAMCAADLRRACDEFVDIEKYKISCGRPFEVRALRPVPKFGA